MFSTSLDNFHPFSSNLKLSSANSFSLEESKICCLVMGSAAETDKEPNLLAHIRLHFNLLPDDKILDWSKLKQIADENIHSDLLGNILKPTSNTVMH